MMCSRPRTLAVLGQAWILFAILLMEGTGAAQISPLSYRVVDAEYSKQLDKIILVSAAPNQLHIYDPNVRQDTAVVDLPLVPSSVSVGPDGLFAAVGHDAWISYVNLSSPRLEKTVSVQADVLDIVLAGNGYVYAFPRRDQWTHIRSVNIATGSDQPQTGNQIYAGTLGKLHPGGRAMYGANNGLSPSDIEKYDISGGVARLLYDSPYHGDYPMCGDLWIAEDGLRIFTKCGKVFRSSEVQTQDMTYNGALGEVAQVRHLSHSLVQRKVAVIPQAISFSSTPAANDTEVQIYGYEFLSFLGRNYLPSFRVESRSYPAHGRFVFFNSVGSKYFVVAQADNASGLLNDFGVVTFNTTVAGGISISSNGVVNGASFSVGAAAGSIGSLFGENVAALTIVASTVPLPTSLGGVTVQVNGIAAPLFFVSPFQINFQFPWELPNLGGASITVTVDGVSSSPQTVELNTAGPGIFTTSSTGTGQGAILIAGTGDLAAPFGSVPGRSTRAASRNGVISIYCTGLGDVVNRPANGTRSPSSPLATTFETPTVRIGGEPAEVTFSGLAPSFVGLYQVNVRVPQTAPTGNAVPVVLRIGEVNSNTVTIAVQ